MPIRLASQLPVQQPDWIWPGYVPLGALTVLTGDPGGGKSLLSLDLAARVTTGSAMPDGSATVTNGGGVGLVSHEDDINSVVIPRLSAAGADLSRVVPLADLSFPDDANEIVAAMKVVDARLLVLDPASSVLASGHKRVLDALNSLARDNRCGVLLVRHVRKAGGKALYAGAGSMAITGSARAEHVVFCAPDDPAMRVFAPVKFTFGIAPTPYSFCILASPGTNPRVHWVGPSVHDADALTLSVRDRPALDEAVAFLHEVLAHGPVDVPTIRRLSMSAGISWRTLVRARRDVLRWPSRRGPHAWYWSLP